MIDDERAEHVPGCNLAARRDKLLALGGFDEQFRVAGDDVDICWRFLDAGHTVAYAPAALVWHRRRSTIKAYLKQQAGYGRAESMLHFKYPVRFNPIGIARQSGVIYGDGSVGGDRAQIWKCFTSLEWHGLAVLCMLLGVLDLTFMFVAAGMWSLTLMSVLRAGLSARLPHDAPRWCRPMVSLLHLVQPCVVAWARYRHRLCNRTLPDSLRPEPACCRFVKHLGRTTFDLYWQSADGRGREQLLERAVQLAGDIARKATSSVRRT